MEVHIFGQITNLLGLVLSQKYNESYKKCVRGHPGSKMRSLLVNPKNKYETRSFGSSPDETNKARDSKFALNLDYIGI